MGERFYLITWPESRSVSVKTMRGWAADAVANGDIGPFENIEEMTTDELATELDHAGIITWYGEIGGDEDDETPEPEGWENDPAEGWLGDSYMGAYDDDPSPYDGNYSEM